MFHPSKVIAIGLNYTDHAKELKMALPDYPMIFLKPETSVIQNNGTIICPPQSNEVQFEGELGIVIKDRIRNVPIEDALTHVAGYCCANDVTARDLQRKDGQWTRCKSFDTFCPLGPKVVSELDPSALRIQTRVNGQVKQDSSTARMIFGPAYLVAFVSSVMTIMPGDVIITGTPPGVGTILPGDTVEVEIEGIGILRNRVGK
jgi:2-keto-4-pentenoate hydratase/2-oxohepta-3-ene-1,7-dioic acid hydratase in catechol pathway